MAGRLPAPIQAELEQVLRTGQHHLPNTLHLLHRFRLGEGAALPQPPRRAESAGDHIFGIVIMLQDVTEMRLLDEVKTNVVSTVSHELKTPVTSLRTALRTCYSIRPRARSPPGSASSLTSRAKTPNDWFGRSTRCSTSPGSSTTRTASSSTRSRPKPSCGRRWTRPARPFSRPACSSNSSCAEALPAIRVDQERIQHVLDQPPRQRHQILPPGGRVLVRARPTTATSVSAWSTKAPACPRIPVADLRQVLRVPGIQAKGVGLGLSIARIASLRTTVKSASSANPDRAASHSTSSCPPRSPTNQPTCAGSCILPGLFLVGCIVQAPGPIGAAAPRARTMWRGWEPTAWARTSGVGICLATGAARGMDELKRGTLAGIASALCAPGADPVSPFLQIPIVPGMRQLAPSLKGMQYGRRIQNHHRR